MKINLHYLIIFLLGICNAFDFELMNNSVIISGENFYSENPFTGGVNKPKIQWVDWNNDSLIDLFILDEDNGKDFSASVNLAVPLAIFIRS